MHSAGVLRPYVLMDLTGAVESIVESAASPPLFDLRDLPVTCTQSIRPRHDGSNLLMDHLNRENRETGRHRAQGDRPRRGWTCRTPEIRLPLLHAEIPGVMGAKTATWVAIRRRTGKTRASAGRMSKKRNICEHGIEHGLNARPQIQAAQFAKLDESPRSR